MIRRATIALVLMAVTVHASPATAQQARRYNGMRLDEALQAMQTLGLRIVYSSAVVSPELRVLVEPRGRSPKEQLDELLAPHGLGIRKGPGGILQVVRAKPARRRSTSPSHGTVKETVVDVIAQRHSEYVSVEDSAPHRVDRGVPSEMSLERSDFTRLHGSFAEDPVRAVHVFPGVVSVDDFRSDFVVRGSPFRHVDFVIDGVSTQWLQHTAYGRGASGSLTMLPGLVVERATLRSGAYPRRHGDRLGPELDLTLREGSRSGFGLRGAIGGTHAVLVGEGPIGSGSDPEGAARGSWLVSARQSYLQWPPQSAASRAAFGFSDAVAKLVFDVRPTQQLALTVLGGITSLDDEDNLAPTDLADGTNRASVFNVSWRSAIGPALVVNQHASIVSQRFRNIEASGRESDRGANRAVGYRVDLSRPLAGGLLEAGARVEQTTTTEAPRSPEGSRTAGSSWLRSGFAHFAWAAAPSLTLSPGVRVTSSSLLRAPVVSRWVLGEWTFRRGWGLIGSAGASHQLPELRYVLGEDRSPGLRVERAVHSELGVEHQLTSTLRWQATLFQRSEADVLRFPDLHPRLVGDLLVYPAHEKYSNALQGASRGVELLVSRRSGLGLSGWAAYSFGRMRQTDAMRGETYWSDFDQRHTLNVFAHYRLSATTSVGATFRAGSNFPLHGYFAERDGRLVVGSARNQVRLPPYVRLDLRADRELQVYGRRVTLFVEALNALNRLNVGQASGSVDPMTGAAVGFTDALLRRRVSAGMVIQF